MGRSTMQEDGDKLSKLVSALVSIAGRIERGVVHPEPNILAGEIWEQAAALAMIAPRAVILPAFSDTAAEVERAVVLAVISYVAGNRRLSPAAILSRSNARDVVRWRYYCMWLCQELFGYSYHQLARIFDRDPDTVRRNIRAAVQAYDKNSTLRVLLDGLKMGALRVIATMDLSAIEPSMIGGESNDR